jgi:hypothetical protein
MTTIAHLKDLPQSTLVLHLVKSRDEAEQLAAQSRQSWYFETPNGKYKNLFMQPKETNEN